MEGSIPFYNMYSMEPKRNHGSMELPWNYDVMLWNEDKYCASEFFKYFIFLDFVTPTIRVEFKLKDVGHKGFARAKALQSNELMLCNSM
jgi:hypothetical protein